MAVALTFASYGTWCVNGIYFCALIPQLRLNFKRQSTAGLSDAMVLFYFCAYFSKLIYVYSLSLPLAYKIQSPLSLCAIVCLIIQRIYYNHDAHKIFFMRCWALLIVGFSLCAFLAQMHFSYVGYMCGWMTTLFFAIYQIPQIRRVYKTKSTNGLSIFFVLILLCGTLLEFCSAFILKLPTPTLLNGLRGMIIYSLLLSFFVLYSNSTEYKTKKI